MTTVIKMSHNSLSETKSGCTFAKSNYDYYRMTTVIKMSHNSLSETKSDIFTAIQHITLILHLSDKI